MQKAQFKLSTQIGNKGFFGRIIININNTTDNDLKIIYSDSNALIWKSSIEFGVSCFREKYKLFYNKDFVGKTIDILEIDHNIIDTTSMIIAYIVIKALCSYYEISEIIHPIFDNKTGIFIFDK